MSSNAEKVQMEIRRAIDDDPAIKSATHVLVNMEKDGFWIFGKDKIVLKGRVETEVDKKNIEEKAQLHSHGIEVVDTIRVEAKYR